MTTAENIHLFLQHKRAGVGLLITVLSFPVFLIYGFDADFNAVYFHLKKVKEVDGYIEFIGDTDISDDEEIVQEFDFTFSVPETSEAFRGNSYSAYDYTHKVGEKVKVEYIVENPYISRIKGMDGAPHGFWKIIFVGSIILYGYLMFTIAFVTFLRKKNKSNP